MRALKSAIFWSYLALMAAILFPIALGIWALTRPFDKRSRLLHRFTCWWGYHYVEVCPFWKTEIIGREKIPNDGCFVYVANHLSLGDILMLFGIKKHFKWVSKSSVFKVPFIGWNMWLNNYVGLVRGDRKSIVEMFKACRQHIERGSSVLLFPEGTRSKTGRLKSFKAGAFSLAVQTNVPIIPVILRGTYEALPVSTWIFPHRKPLRVTVQLLDPIDPAAADNDPQKLMTLVHGIMLDALGEGEGRPNTDRI